MNKLQPEETGFLYSDIDIRGIAVSRQRTHGDGIASAMLVATEIRDFYEIDRSVQLRKIAVMKERISEIEESLIESAVENVGLMTAASIAERIEAKLDRLLVEREGGTLAVDEDNKLRLNGRREALSGNG